MSPGSMEHMQDSGAEERRISALRKYSILDAGADPDLDALTKTAARLFDAPIVLVSLIDEHRQVFRSRIGTDLCETPRAGSFCDVAITKSVPLVVPDATKDPRFLSSPYVIGEPYVQFYAGAQLFDPAGEILGSFCVLDTKPREAFADHHIETLKAYAAEASEILTQPAQKLGQSGSCGKRASRFFDLFVRDLTIAAAMVDKDLKYVAVSDMWYDVFNIQEDDIIGISHLTIEGSLSADRESFYRAVVDRGETESDVELTIRRSDGGKVWLRCDSHPWFEDDGSIGGMMMYRSIINDEIDMRSEIVEQQEKHERIYNQTPAMLLTISPHGAILQASDFLLKKTGYSREEIVGSNATEFMTDESVKHMNNIIRTDIQHSGSVTDEPINLVAKNGVVLHTALSASVERDVHGVIFRLNCLLFDVGELRAMERKLEQSEQDYEELYNHSPIMLHSVDAQGRINNISGFWQKTMGYDRSEVIGRPLADFMTEECAIRARNFEMPVFLQTGEADETPYTLVTKSGAHVDVRLTAVTRFDDAGVPAGATAVMRDETAERKSRAKATKSQRLFEAFFHNLPACMYVKSLDSEYRLFNKSFEDAYGVSHSKQPFRAIDIMGANAAAAIDAIDSEVVETRASVHKEITITDKNDQRCDLDIRKFPIFHENGDLWLIGGVNLDVTERREMEDSFRHAQKMEAIGNLTGGIAHDFNNILAIILGNLQLLERKIKCEGKAADRLSAAIEAADRGASLTRQLLAYSRRQELDPAILDVNNSLRNLQKMLSRTLSEGITINLNLAEGLPSAFVDEGQLQNCMLNLAINARDAMPDGGNLQIETRNIVVEQDNEGLLEGLKRGRYVCISLTDTGCGMTPEIRDRVFEPFYTTKPIGKGTGLGMAMVYGFIKQSGGHVTIYSEVDCGTTIRLYLPVAQGGEETMDDPMIAETADAVGRILVVEDDDGVRSIVEEMLEDIGYETISVSSGPEALKILEQDQAFTLIFSDVIMPGGMTGVDLAQVISERYAALPVLLTSGYPRDAIKTDTPVHILPKPYKHEQLAAEVSKAISEHAGP